MFSGIIKKIFEKKNHLSYKTQKQNIFLKRVSSIINFLKSSYNTQLTIVSLDWNITKFIFTPSQKRQLYVQS